MALSDYVSQIATANAQIAHAAEAIDKELLRIRNELDHAQEESDKLEKVRKDLTQAASELAKAQALKAEIDSKVAAIKAHFA